VNAYVEPIDYDRCARADIVGVTGMVVQRQRMREVLAELRQRGVFVVVGSPWARGMATIRDKLDHSTSNH
jgi:hypothetical protein